MTDPGDTQDGTERLAQLITQGLMEVGDELTREDAKFPTAVALMEEVGRRVAAQVTQDGTPKVDVNDDRAVLQSQVEGLLAEKREFLRQYGQLSEAHDRAIKRLAAQDGTEREGLDTEYLRTRIKEIADELEHSPGLFDTMKSWPKGSNGPIAVAERAERATFMLRAALMRTNREPVVVTDEEAERLREIVEHRRD